MRNVDIADFVWFYALGSRHNLFKKLQEREIHTQIEFGLSMRHQFNSTNLYIIWLYESNYGSVLWWKW